MLELERSAEKARAEQKGGEERLMTKQELIEKYGPKGRMAGGVESRGDAHRVIMAKDGKFVCRGGGQRLEAQVFQGLNNAHKPSL